jgi:uncharacterized protein (UPF0303 family)
MAGGAAALITYGSLAENQPAIQVIANTAEALTLSSFAAFLEAVRCRQIQK